jgi:hypothetical protein
MYLWETLRGMVSVKYSMLLHGYVGNSQSKSAVFNAFGYLHDIAKSLEFYMQLSMC